MSKFRLLQDWQPRDYQKPALNAWIRDGVKSLDLIWHRRAGKDTICMMGTCIKAFQRVANYVHMLPQENQSRTAIWDAVNPHTGRLKIDEAFPLELRAKTNDQKMMITFINGSTWQLFGSDNYHKAIGSTPAGIVWSEWSLSNPASETYLDPILEENGGWKLKIGTARGKNHAFHSFMFARNEPDEFAQLLSVTDTGFDKTFDIDKILRREQAKHGEDLGRALVNQEYFCSFDAAVIGAVWGGELSRLKSDGRLTECPHDPLYPVFTAWDIGRSDSTAIWFYQVIANEVRLIDYLEDNLKNPDWFASRVLGVEVSIDLIDDKIIVTRGKDQQGAEHRKAYDYQTHWLPHDARAKTFASQGKSVQELLWKCFGVSKVQITPNLSKQDQIQAARKMTAKVVFDKRCEKGFEAIKQYRYETDEKHGKLKDKPLHDWTSNAADAYMYVAVSYRTDAPQKPKDTRDKTQFYTHDLTPIKKKKAW